ncbi:tRNA intron endonuclease, putative [Plasmodium chabaudi chabaudi]|uniref:tRNA-intron lyase n=1 Tax=Plasmodium chabaudi chabaudi TaxID=31271 RepID=A0A1D3LH69_PLACU|nr:tRNA intron endonuclease, putative [Plasmodium chabaudi chabaudi]
MTNRIAKREIVYNDLNNHFVVINDIKYGSDFALYKESVDHEHAFALVFIKDESSILTDKDKIIISRICESVKKRGIIAYVDDHTKTIKYEELTRNKK